MCAHGSGRSKGRRRGDVHVQKEVFEATSKRTRHFFTKREESEDRVHDRAAPLGLVRALLPSSPIRVFEVYITRGVLDIVRLSLLLPATFHRERLEALGQRRPCQVHVRGDLCAAVGAEGVEGDSSDDMHCDQMTARLHVKL